MATTRLILTAGADGAPAAEAQLAAGRVVWAFSRFVTSGSLAVGVILFAIIIIVQFVVITRGASRISEVAARFVLDAMPGKQMAIDADLSAGLITEAKALRRREQIAREADFYGAMDGASKFIRGDAAAAAIITGVNIIGGLYVGVFQYGWTWSHSVGLFTRLTIGDGLVTQIPALIVSISAALIVTRSTTRTNLGEEVIRQLTSKPVVLVITAVFLGLLALTSLPRAPLVMLGLGCGGLAYIVSRRRGVGATGQDGAVGEPGLTAPSSGRTEIVKKVPAVQPMSLDIGYALVPLVDPEQRAARLRRPCRRP